MTETAAHAPQGRVLRSMNSAGLRAVFERDFLVFTSRPRFLLLRTMTVVVPSLVFLTMISSMSAMGRDGMRYLGPTVFGTSDVLLPALVMLLAPVLAASCIASERALQTLPIVLAAPVTPFGFVLAKFLSRLGVVLLLVFATLPLAGLCFLYGGVSAGLFLELVAFLVGLAMLGTAAGIVASSWSRSVAAATLTSYFLSIALPVIHYALAMTWVASRRGATAAMFQGEALLDANPFYVWFNGLTMRGMVTGRVVNNPGAVFLAYSCGFAALAVVVGAWRVGREAAHEATSGSRRGRVRKLKYDNPALDRALSGTLLHRPRLGAWLRLVFLLAVDGVTMTVAVASNSMHTGGPHAVFLCVSTFVISLGAMTSASHSIAAERETGALDMLLATRLTPREVAVGKYAGQVLGAAPLAAVALLHGLVAAALTDLKLISVLAWLLGLALVTGFFTAVGLWCSASAATAGRAVLRSYAFLIGGAVIHAVAGILLIIVGSAMRLPGSNLYLYVWGPSPFWIGIAGVVLSFSDHMSEDAGHGLAAWVLWSVAYLAAIPILLTWTTSKLERRNETT